MSWHTCIVCLKQTPDGPPGESLLAQLGLSPLADSEPLSFEDATSSHSEGLSVGQPPGWTVLCDLGSFDDIIENCPPEFPDGMWNSGMDLWLKRVSGSGVEAYYFIMEGGAEFYGFAAYSQGIRKRLRLFEGGRKIADIGAPLSEEQGTARKRLSEKVILGLLEDLCVSFADLDDTEFRYYGRDEVATTPDALVPGGNGCDGEATTESQINPSPLIAKYIKELSSKKMQVRHQAASDLGSAARTSVPTVEAAVPALIAALSDVNVWVRITTSLSLAAIGEAAHSAIPAMLPLLQSEDDDERGYVALALAEFRPVPEEVMSALLKLLGDPGKTTYMQKKRSYPIRLRVAIAIAKADPTRDEVIPIIEEILLSTKPVSAEFSHTLDMLWEVASRGTRYAPILKAKLEGASFYQRVNIMDVLSQIDATFIVTEPEVKRLINQTRSMLKRPLLG